jgi:hypothetical protein
MKNKFPDAASAGIILPLTDSILITCESVTLAFPTAGSTDYRNVRGLITLIKILQASHIDCTVRPDHEHEVQVEASRIESGSLGYI